MMRITGASGGWMWIRMGWSLYRKDPAGWLLLLLAFLMATAAINLVPVVGPLVATALLPALSMGLMQACVDGQSGAPVRPRHLLGTLLRMPADMLRLGIMYLVAMLVALAAAAPADGGVLLRQMLVGTPPGEEALRDGSYLNAMALAGVFATPVLMCFWFAPMLVAWRRLGIGQALFYSFFASLRNWRAFLVYGLLLFCGLMVASLAIATVGLALGGTPAALRGTMLGLIVVAMPAITASFYFSYLDIFPPGDPGENPHSLQV